jgi:hypothetical protein
LVEKRFVALAAAAFAVLPFLLAVIPGIRGRSSSSDVIATAAGMLAIGFTGGLAVILGGSVIGRDLAENRLSFYFSRPVGAASIWFGKVTAALALIVAAFVIIVAPARLGAAAGWQRTLSGWGSGSLALGVLGGAMVLFFAAHVIGSFVRSRSAWIAFDFLALLVAAYVTYLIIMPLLWHGAELAVKTLIGIIGAGVLVALIGGGAWQLERGRTDRKRSHVALSQFVWASIGGALLIAGALLAWMASASPRDLKTPFLETPRSGSWAFLGGDARARLDYPVAFLYDLDSGKYSRLSTERLWRTAFTPDGKTLLVSRVQSLQGQSELFRRAVGGSDELPTGLTMPLSSDFVTTESGDRVATVSGMLLSVYDVTHRQSLGSVRLPGGQDNLVAMYFASPALVRVVTFNFFRTTDGPAVTRTLRLFEFDVVRRSLQETGTLQNDARSVGVGANEDGSLLLVRDYRKGVTVIDGHTAAVHYAVPVTGLHSAALLRSGGVAFARTTNGGVAVDITDASGNVVRTVNLPAAIPGPIHELRDGRLVMSTRAVAQADGELATVVIDPAAGTVVSRIPGSVLAENPIASRLNFDPRRAPIDFPRIYHTTKGDLVRWNPSTNIGEPLLR